MEDLWDGESIGDSFNHAFGDSFENDFKKILAEHNINLRNLSIGKGLVEDAVPRLTSHPFVIDLVENRHISNVKEFLCNESFVHDDSFSVFIFLCHEVNYLSELAEKKYYGCLNSFCQDLNLECDDNQPKFGTGEMAISVFLPVLHELMMFVFRCYHVLHNFVRQLASVYSENSELYRLLFKDSRFAQLFGSGGELLIILLTLDNCISQNPYLLEYWTSYKRLIANKRYDIHSMNIPEEKMSEFEALLVSLDTKLLSGRIFLEGIHQNFEIEFAIEAQTYHPEQEFDIIAVNYNHVFTSMMLTCQQILLEKALEGRGRTAEYSQQRSDIVGAFALYALYRTLLPRQVMQAPLLNACFMDAAIYRTLLNDLYSYVYCMFRFSYAYLCLDGT